MTVHRMMSSHCGSVALTVARADRVHARPIVTPHAVIHSITAATDWRQTMRGFSSPQLSPFGVIEPRAKVGP
jgi:hypothetical protein